MLMFYLLKDWQEILIYHLLNTFIQAAFAQPCIFYKIIQGQSAHIQYNNLYNLQ